jgi:tetratricopeptide (TPR) repeat protein
MQMHIVQRLYEHARSSGEIEPLEEALARVRDVVSIMTAAHRTHLGVSTEYGRCLSLRFRLRGDIADLRAAIAIFREAVEEAGPGDADMPACLNNLGNALADWYQHTRDPGDLTEAECAFRRAADSLMPGDPRLPTLLTGLSDSLLSRYWISGHVRDLDEAITAARRAATEARPGDPGRAILLTGLTNVLAERYQRVREVSALDEAEGAARQALGETSTGTPDRAVALHGLGLVLNLRHSASGNLDALDEAEQALGECVTITPPGDPSRGSHLNSLGAILWSRYLVSGDLRAMDQSANAFRDAAAALPEGHEVCTFALANLANTLANRYEMLGDLAALDEAITAFQRAIKLTPADPHCTPYLSRLSSALLARYRRLGEQADITSAEDAACQALQRAPAGSILRPMFQSSLSNILRERYQGGMDPGALDAAEHMLRQALTEAPPGDPGRLIILSNLGITLCEQHKRPGRTAVLREAIDVLRQAERCAASADSRRPAVLVNLGEALRGSYERDPAPAVLAEAMSILSEATGIATALPRQRAQAAMTKGRLAASAGCWPEAADAYQLAVGLLPTVASQQLDRRDKEHSLAEFTGLASDAAAAALHCGRTGQAATLLECGRGVLFAQALSLRTEHDDLRAIAPGLARRFQHLSRRLRAELTARDALRRAVTSGASARVLDFTSEITKRNQIVQDWDQALADIRKITGLENFLQPPTPRQVLTDAGGGPVAILNVSRHRSDALILSDGAFRIVPLPMATPKAVADQATAFLSAAAVATGTAGSRAGQQAEDKLLEILRWLWEAVTGPVIRTIEPVGKPTPGDPARRLWWMPTGLLSLLPLHAADPRGHGGSHDPHSAPSRIISSYVPTLRALGRAMRTQVPATDGRTLIVTSPHTPGWADLPAAQVEGNAVAQLNPRSWLLSGTAATSDRVLAELPRYDNFHFAGHAQSNLTNPSASALILRDRPLTVTDISDLRLTHANLAYLSACETAMPGTTLIDEAITIASACQLAGFRHVVATLWPVGDHIAADVAAGIWHAAKNEADAENTATALFHITSELRRKFPRNPSLWAAYVHVGP